MQAIEDGGDTQNFSSSLVGNIIVSTDLAEPALPLNAHYSCDMLRSWHTYGTYLSIAAFLLLPTSDNWPTTSSLASTNPEKRVATLGDVESMACCLEPLKTLKVS